MNLCWLCMLPVPDIESMDPRLYQSAKLGQVDSFKHLLHQNPGILSKVTPQGNTALHIAVKFGHKGIVTEICGRCVSLLIKQNLHGDTPLHIAARAGHFSIVDFLVRAIFSSSWGGREDEIMGKFGILSMGNRENSTVLHEAVRNGHLCVVQLLLKVDPKLASLENSAGESPLYLAAREGMLEIVNEILTSTTAPAHGGSEGQTALHAAVIERHHGIMQVLLRAKPELIREVDHHGRTCLYYAASLGDNNTVKQLLELDNTVAYVLDKHGHSPLHVAASSGHVNIIKELIRHCPDSAELVDLCGRNALHAAILSGKGNVIRYMLETAETEGLINQPDEDGNTPLHLATMGRKTWIVRYLIWDKRVDRRAKNKKGQTAFDIDHSIRESCLTVPTKTVSIIWRKFSSPPTWNIRENIPPSANQEAEDAKMQSYKQMGQTLLMVTTLITTVTFAAAFTMPGGYSQNGPNQGLALLNASKTLGLFVIYDIIAMTCSTTAACLIFWGAISSKESYPFYLALASFLTYIALQSTAGAFMTGIIAVLPHHDYIDTMAVIVAIAFNIITCLFLFQLLQIFYISEVSQFFISHLYKLKLRKINK
ncbi:hypothetical protein QUC31_001880 [Theobroma cacao]